MNSPQSIEEEIVRTVFRVWQDEARYDQHLIALFPERPTNPRNQTACQVYSYHTETLMADYDYCISRSRSASVDEYEELQAHLERVYCCRIIPVSRRTAAMKRRFQQELMSWQQELSKKLPGWKEKDIYFTNYLSVRP